MESAHQAIEGFALSPQQRRLWRTASSGGPGVTCVLFELGAGAGSALDPEHLLGALRRLPERHEALRTGFRRLPGMEAPIQVIADRADVTPAVVEVPAERDEAERRLLAEELERPFDLDGPPLVRFTLTRGPDGRHRLLVALSPLCGDLRTAENLVADALRVHDALLAGAEAPEPPLQYVQYSEWLNELLEDEEEREGRDFWHALAASVEDPGRLPGTDAEDGAAGSRDARRPRVAGRLDAQTAAAVARASEGLGVEQGTFLFAAWHTCLARRIGRDDLVTGWRDDGRRYDELREAAGAFARTLPISAEAPARAPFSEVVERVGQALEAASTWADFLDADGVPEPAGSFELEAPPEAERYRVLSRTEGAEGSGVSLRCTAREGAWDLELSYDGGRHGALAGERWLSSFEALVKAASREPSRRVGELPSMGEAERRQVVCEWAVGRPAASEREDVAAALASRLLEVPDRVALEWEGGSLSYGELGRRVSSVASVLRAGGVGPEGRVGLCVERSADWLVGLWSVLWSGGAYVVLDPAQPEARWRGMLEESGASWVLADGASRRRFGAETPGVRWADLADLAGLAELAEGAGGAPGALGLPVRAPESSAAYVLYTSGSTGRPKGVVVRRGSLSNLARALAEEVYEVSPSPAGEALRVGWNAPLGFDASVKQWLQGVWGHTLCLVPEGVRLEGGEGLLSWLESRRVEVLDATPSQLGALPGGGPGERAPSLSRVLVGGEAIGPAQWRRMASERGRDYRNVYGPTETTVDATARRVSGEAPELGGPLTGVRTYGVDARLAPVPVGVAGELVIGGEGVSRGYLGRPGRTAERFVPDPFGDEPGGRLYRSGDRVRWLDGGRLESLGRLDGQVKLRGFRVETGEVAAALAAHPGVREVAVSLRADGPGGAGGEGRLVAYVVGRGGGSGTYALPNGWVVAHRNRNETEYLYREIFEERAYERRGLELPEDAVVVDVGANIGMFALYAAERSPGARIYSFEPLAPLVETLRWNAELAGGRVKVLPYGLSDREREERLLYYPRYTMMSGQSDYAAPESEVEVIRRFLSNAVTEGSRESAALLSELDELLAGRFEGREMTCRLRRLSDVLTEEGIERVDLLKIDVQRAELDVLRGIAPEHWERIAQVVLEVHDGPEEATAGRVGAVRALLEGEGFRVTVEQDPLLEGTDRHMVYAARPEARRSPAASGGGLERRAVSALEAGALREWLRERLPDYMMPSAFVELDRLPLTRHGKVDREALPAPEEAAAVEEALEEPATPHEELLAGIWREVLGVERVGAGSSFFELGGHSLLATQVMSRVRETFGVEVPLRVLFEQPVLSELAARIDAARRAGDGPEVPPIEPLPRDGRPLPLSFAQRRLWFLERVAGRSGGSAYNNPFTERVTGPLSAAALARTFGEVARRHEVLRTTFGEERGEPFQVVHPPAPVPLPVIDLSGLPEARREAEGERVARAEARRPFDLARGPLLRVRLVRLRAGAVPLRHLLLLTLHHVVADAWSLGVLVREVSALYTAFEAGRPSPLPELPVQYADYAAWQRDWLAAGALERHLSYWKAALADPPPPLRLPARPAVPDGDPAGRGASHAFRITGERMEALREIARGAGATLFMTVLALLQVLLYRLTGQTDLVIGADIANRNRREIEPLIGFFVNLLVLRGDLSGDPGFRRVLRRAREATLGAYDHQDLPFDRLVEELKPDRAAGRNPLFQVLLVMQNAPRGSFDLPGLELRRVEVSPGEAKFDLALFLAESSESLHGVWRYDAARIDDDLVAAMAEQLGALVEELAAEPDRTVDSLTLSEALQERTRTMESPRKPKPSFAQFAAGAAEPVAPAHGELVTLRLADPDGGRLPLEIRPRLDDVDLVEWAAGNRDLLEEKLAEHGGILFRGFSIRTADEFEALAAGLCDELFGDYGDLPHAGEGGRVYRSTPYPEAKTILFHNESSHQGRWPRKQLFCCVLPSTEGGNTPIVDCRLLYQRLDPEARATFEEKGLMYVRNFTEGLDVSWRDFFHTDDRARVEDACRRMGMEWEWRDDGGLRTRQVCPAVVSHPITGERSFFNQIQLHHVSMLDPETRGSLESLFGEGDLPRNVYFGDGSPIPDALVHEITDLYWAISVELPWQAGDVLMVDNMLTAHARRPYKEPRKILVVMGDVVSRDAA